MIDFRGWARTSLIDFPGHIATVLFVGGCDFRCPMCHNSDLVLRPGTLPAIDPDEVLAFLRRRAGKVTGLVLTGGEPLLQPGVAPFLAAVKACGVQVKLDTNGYHPNALSSLLSSGLVDYVAMDVKAPPMKYPLLAGRETFDLDRILTSVSLLAQGRAPWEFRTTVVPGLLDGDDIEAIARWLSAVGGRASVSYALQQFRGVQTLDPGLEGREPYAVIDLRSMADCARRWLDNVILRGI